MLGEDFDLQAGSIEASSHFEYHTDGDEGLHIVHEGTNYVLVAEEGEEPRLVHSDGELVECDRCHGEGRHIHSDGISKVNCEKCDGTGKVVVMGDDN